MLNLSTIIESAKVKCGKGLLFDQKKYRKFSWRKDRGQFEMHYRLQCWVASLTRADQ